MALLDVTLVTTTAIAHRLLHYAPLRAKRLLLNHISIYLQHDVIFVLVIGFDFRSWCSCGKSSIDDSS